MVNHRQGGSRFFQNCSNHKHIINLKTEIQPTNNDTTYFNFVWLHHLNKIRCSFCYYMGVSINFKYNIALFIFYFRYIADSYVAEILICIPTYGIVPHCIQLRHFCKKIRGKDRLSKKITSTSSFIAWNLIVQYQKRKNMCWILMCLSIPCFSPYEKTQGVRWHHQLSDFYSQGLWAEIFSLLNA